MSKLRHGQQVKDPVLEVVERLLRAQSLPELFEAVPAALGPWLPMALTRLYLLDPDSQPPHHQLFTMVGRGVDVRAVTLPLSAGKGGLGVR